MNTLVEMINSMEVREDDETFKNAVDYMFDGLERRSPQHFAVRQVIEIEQKETGKESYRHRFDCWCSYICHCMCW